MKIDHVVKTSVHYTVAGAMARLAAARNTSLRFSSPYDDARADGEAFRDIAKAHGTETVVVECLTGKNDFEREREIYALERAALEESCACGRPIKEHSTYAPAQKRTVAIPCIGEAEQLRAVPLELHERKVGGHKRRRCMSSRCLRQEEATERLVIGEMTVGIYSRGCGEMKLRGMY